MTMGSPHAPWRSERTIEEALDPLGLDGVGRRAIALHREIRRRTDEGQTHSWSTSTMSRMPLLWVGWCWRNDGPYPFVWVGLILLLVASCRRLELFAALSLRLC